MSDFQVHWKRQRERQVLPALAVYPEPSFADASTYLTAFSLPIQHKINFERNLLQSLELNDFPCYKEVDPNKHIVQEACKIYFTDLGRDEDAYTYVDKGAAYFDGDFNQTVACEITSATALEYSIVSVWAAGNTLDDIGSIANSLSLEFNNNADVPVFQLKERVASAQNALDTSVTMSFNTVYYARIIRDDIANTLTAKIYTGSLTGTLVDTLSISLTAGVDWRYIFPVSSFNSGLSGKLITGWVSDLDLDAATPDASTYMPAWGLAKSNKSEFTRKLKTPSALDRYRLKGITIDGFAEFYGTLHGGSVGVTVVPATQIPTAWLNPLAYRYIFNRKHLVLADATMDVPIAVIPAAPATYAAWTPVVTTKYNFKRVLRTPEVLSFYIHPGDIVHTATGYVYITDTLTDDVLITDTLTGELLI